MKRVLFSFICFSFFYCMQGMAQGSQQSTVASADGAKGTKDVKASPALDNDSSLAMSMEILMSMDALKIKLNAASATEKFEILREQRKIGVALIENTIASVRNLELSFNSYINGFSRQAAVNPELSTIKKNQLESEIKEAEEKLDKLKATRGRKDNMEMLEKRIIDYKSSLSLVDKEIADSESEKISVAKRVVNFQKTSKELDLARSELIRYQRHLASIDDMVNQIFIQSDAQNGFKLKMSFAFAGLVGVVIGGFFLIAWSNDEIKKTIFGNDAGIQFITIFSIVIAVILFGIIGVLESKELSALLGGLSGYILGKSKGQETIVVSADRASNNPMRSD